MIVVVIVVVVVVVVVIVVVAVVVVVEGKRGVKCTSDGTVNLLERVR
mgnify:CR=1 FL=1